MRLFNALRDRLFGSPDYAERPDDAPDPAEPVVGETLAATEEQPRSGAEDAGLA